MQLYDVVAVGGGTAAAVVAARLSEHPQAVVLAYETGIVKPRVAPSVPGPVVRAAGKTA
ncbi:MAG: GMC family oxidoreductase N-terminal domain-containing protein [Solirubrobacterales bacterium]|nr:GMC family oxidoreductase N-terminal domain-containing protein [Solirubrobacterales bacterium]